jgi:hypothetical protein
MFESINIWVSLNVIFSQQILLPPYTAHSHWTLFPSQLDLRITLSKHIKMILWILKYLLASSSRPVHKTTCQSLLHIPEKCITLPNVLRLPNHQFLSYHSKPYIILKQLTWRNYNSIFGALSLVPPKPVTLCELIFLHILTWSTNYWEITYYLTLTFVQVMTVALLRHGMQAQKGILRIHV